MLDNNFSSIRNALAKNASALKGVSVSAVYAATDVGNPPAHVAAAAAATTASSLADAETAVRTHAIENTQLRYLVAELRAQLASQEEDAATDLERFRRQAEIHATLLAAAHSEVRPTAQAASPHPSRSYTARVNQGGARVQLCAHAITGYFGM